MLGTRSRREILTGALRKRERVIRPPWSVDEFSFADNCTACGECGAACPEKIIVNGSKDLPEIDFSAGACTFCGACADTCPEEPKLFNGRDGQPWLVIANFTDQCLSSNGVTCRVCGDRCDHRAIRFRLEVGGRAHPELSASACTGCGDCVAGCPVGAIKMEYPE